MLTVPFRRKDVKNENPHQIFSIPHQIFLIMSMTFCEFGTDATVGYTVRSNSCKRLSIGMFVPEKDTLREANEGKGQIHYRTNPMDTVP